MKLWHRLLIAGLMVIALAVMLTLSTLGGRALLAVAGTIYVDSDATGGENNGTSWDDAFTDLQDGLDAAAPGTEIWVAEGTYKPTSGTDRTASFQMKNDVAIYGGFDPSEGNIAFEDRDWVTHLTILSGDIGTEGDGSDNVYHVFYHPDGTDLDGTAILDGFTITGGKAFSGVYPHSNGGGMYNDNSSPALTNCTFEGNSADLGGGMANYDLSSPTLTNCTFSDNSADWWLGGGGMYNHDSSPALTNCTFEGNSAAWGGGGGMYNYDSSPTLTNRTFDGNSAGNGGGMYNQGLCSPVLTNCAFSGNSAGNGGGMYNSGSSPTLTNCTFSGNLATSGGGGTYNYESSSTLTNCTLEGNSASVGGGMYNYDSSPTLTNCILWGDSPEEIFNDSSSPVVTYSDIQGSYSGEGNLDADPIFVDPGTGDLHLEPGSPCIDAGNNAAPHLLAYDFEGDDRILDGDGDGTIVVDMGIDEVPLRHYVDADATGANDGSSWDDAFTDLQDGLDTAEAGYEIWVAAGTYKPTVEHGGTGDRFRSFQLKNGVALYGGFDPSVGDIAFEDRDWQAHPTILSGDLNGDDEPDFANNDENSYHVFYHPFGTDLGATAILDGFEVTAGNANLWDYPTHGQGGGMLNSGSSPVLANCTFSRNSAVLGGGMVNNASSPTLYNCAFEGNGASAGGGMHNSYSSPALANCTMSDNSAIDGGGGMYNTNSSPALSDCTFSGNSALDDGGGMHNTNSSPTLTGCTFSDNSALDDGGGGMYNYGSSPTLTNCTFSMNSAAWGGGMVNNEDSSPTLTNCTFAHNSARHNGGGIYIDAASPTLTNCTFEGNNSEGGGGGIVVSIGSSPVLTNCIFSGNSAEQSGGGMSSAHLSSPTMTNCTFSGNSAGVFGGGMYNYSSLPTLTNCTFEGNSAEVGGGMYNFASPLTTLTNCTFSGNSAVNEGGGMRNSDSSPILTNCILWGDTPEEIYNSSSSPVVTYSDIQGGYSGEGNIDADPLFLNPGSGDLHLGPGSPCIDVGNNAAPNLPPFDFEGDDRIRDGNGDGTTIVDMGVDEALWLPVHLPLVLKGY